MSAPLALAALSFAGSAVTSRGQARSGAAEQRYYNQQAFNQDLEAAELDTAAIVEAANTGFASDQLRTKINQTRGQQNAAVAASGIELSGSALNFIEVDAARQEFDALALRFNGDARKSSLERTANIRRATGGSLRAEGNVAKKSAKSSAAGTLIGGLGNAATTFVRARG